MNYRTKAKMLRKTTPLKTAIQLAKSIVSFLKPAGTLLSLCLPVFIWAQPVHKLHLLEGTTVVQTHEKSLGRLAAFDPFENKAYALILVNQIPSESELANWRKVGIEVYQYLPEHAYYAILSPAGMALLESSQAPSNIKAAFAVPPSWKLSKGLKTGMLESHSYYREGILEVLAVFQPGLTKGHQSRLAESVGAMVLGRTDEKDKMWLALPEDKLMNFAALPGVFYLEEKGLEDQPENHNGRAMHRVSPMQNGIRNYDGSGINIGHGDDGNIGPHIDFTGRIVFNRSGTSSGDHGDHVAGTILGGGNLNPNGMGMAPGAGLVYSSYPSNYTSIDQDYINYQVRITASSYSNGCNAGYTSTTQQVDQDVVQNPKLMHVFSAGNSGTSDCGYGAGSGWGNITGGHKLGKNVIASANITSSDLIASSSSRGPSNDGRIKPDVSAHGTDVFSTVENNLYASYTGTSMACPGVAGSLAVMAQAFKQTHSGVEADGGLLKAIMMNTADDLGNAGPDFKYGFGRVNVQRAVEVIENNQFTERQISQGGQVQQSIQVPNGVAQLKVMVYWTDPAASPTSGRALVNNLDVVLQGGSQSWLPWVLNPTPNSTALNSAAVRAVDTLNNVEQITLTNPTPGEYNLLISGTSIPQGPQKFYVVYSYEMQGIGIDYPTAGSTLVPGEICQIRWNASPSASSFTLQYSTNGSTWNSIGTASASARIYSWTVPSLSSGSVQMRITRGTESAISSNFAVIASPTGISYNWTCPDSTRLSWSPVSGATAYEIYRLGNRNMDLIGTTTQTHFVAQGVAHTQTEWFSVRAITSAGLPGKRANAVQRPSGVSNCSNVCVLGGTLNVGQIQLNSAQISIGSPLTGVQSYEVQYGPPGFVSGTIVNTSTTTFTLNNLSAATLYEVRVRALCANGSYTNSISTQFSTALCSASNQCNFTIAMSDSYGDGWNGNVLALRQNGQVVASFGQQFTTGTSFTPFTVPLCDAFNTEVVVQTLGSYTSEVGLVITSNTGATVFSRNSGTTFAAGAVLGSFTTACGFVVSCDTVSQLSAVPTASSASLSWNGTASSYQVSYGPAGTLAGGGTLVNTSTNSLNLNNLSAQTNYVFYVRAVCGSVNSAWSRAFNFTTLCSTASMPYSRTFTSWPPTCWDLSGQTRTVVQYNNQFLEASFWSWTAGNNAQITTEPIQLSAAARLRFGWSHLYSSTYPNDAIEVYVKPIGSINWTLLKTLSGPTFTTTGATNTAPAPVFNQEVIGLSAFASQTVQVRLLFKSGYGPDVFVDGFYVEQAVGCDIPSQLTLLNVASDGANIQWSSGVSSADSYEIQVGLQSAPASTYFATFSGTGNIGLISGLQANTDYKVRVRQRCGANWSAFSGVFNFTTGCAIAGLPYLRDFDSWPPTCWQFDGSKTLTQSNGLYLYANFWGWTAGNTAAFNTEPIVLNQAAELKFSWSHLYNVSYPTDSLLVLVRPAGIANTWTRVRVLAGPNFNTSGALSDDPAPRANFIDETISLTAYQGDTIEIRLLFKSGYGPSVFIDDFKVEALSNCAKPTALNASNISFNSASIDWQNGIPTADKWQIEYGPFGYLPGQGQRVIVQNKPFQLSQLTAGQIYSLRIREICSSQDTSAFSQAIQFTTPCSRISDFPALFTFDSIPTNATDILSNCWTLGGITGKSDPRWRTLNTSTPSLSTGPSGDYTGNGNFIFMETSTPASPGDQASVLSPIFDLRDKIQPELHFYYHMYGISMGSLQVDVYDGTSWTNQVWNLSGQQHASSASPWSLATIDLSAWEGLADVQVRFVGTTGSSFDSDMALDQISLTALPAPTEPIVNSISVQNITQNSAVFNALISSTGGLPISQSGVVFAQNANVNLNNGIVLNSNPDTGYFQLPITNLQTQTHYYARAFAVNSVGVAYGNELNFSTLCDSMSLNVNVYNHYSAGFKWRAIAGASSYRLQWKLQGSQSWNNLAASDTFRDVLSLAPGDYWVRVYAFQQGDTSCSKAFSIQCANNLSFNHNLFQATEMGVGGRLSVFSVQGGRRNYNFMAIHSSGDTTAQFNRLSANLSNLKSGQYTFVLSDQMGCEAPTFAFNIEPLDTGFIPYLISMPNASPNGFRAIWNRPKHNGGFTNGIINYQLRLRNETDNQLVQLYTGLLDTTLTITNLIPGKRYKANVRARYNNGQGARNSAYSNARSRVIQASSSKQALDAYYFSKVYPNPFTHEIMVELAEAAEVSIFDFSGRLVYSQWHDGGLNTILLENLSKGAYIIELRGQNAKESFRLLKQ